MYLPMTACATREWMSSLLTLLSPSNGLLWPCIACCRRLKSVRPHEVAEPGEPGAT